MYQSKTRLTTDMVIKLNGLGSYNCILFHRWTRRISAATITKFNQKIINQINKLWYINNLTNSKE